MIPLAKHLAALAAIVALAQCSSTANLDDLPVRDTPQAQLPFTPGPPPLATDS